MKYTCNKNNTDTSKYVSISELQHLLSLTNDTAILVYNPNEGTKVITIEDLIMLLDIRYEKNKHYDANALIDAVDKIFNANSQYDPNYVNINKEYINERLDYVKEEHNDELIKAIDGLFNPKK